MVEWRSESRTESPLKYNVSNQGAMAAMDKVEQQMTMVKVICWGGFLCVISYVCELILENYADIGVAGLLLVFIEKTSCYCGLLLVIFGSMFIQPDKGEPS